MHVGYVCVCLNFSAATPTTTCAKTPLDPPRGDQAKLERSSFVLRQFSQTPEPNGILQKEFQYIASGIYSWISLSLGSEN